jgi:hypothetical membrane protein
MDRNKILYGNLRKAGILIFIGVAQFAIFLMVAEALFPNYSISNNYISDLGAICNRPPASKNSCVFVQPSSMIFNSSIIILGILLILSSYYFLNSRVNRAIPIMIILSGIGCIGVGIFTEATGIIHGIFSLITFLSIGILAIIAYIIQGSPMKYFSIIAGTVTLIALALYINGIYLGLGFGGMERMIVYPVMIWSLAFSGYLMGLEEKTK